MTVITIVMTVMVITEICKNSCYFTAIVAGTGMVIVIGIAMSLMRVHKTHLRLL